jgi:SsrA-binding protein
MSKSTLNITNKRATYEFSLLLRFSAGIMLTGSEIKSVRAGNVNLTDAFCFLKDDELWVKNMHIGQYKQAAHYNHDPLRNRKLLLNKSEIRKLKSKLREKGLTIVPIRMWLSETGYAKIEIALAQGKKTFDKREDIKKRDSERDMKRSET